MRLPLSIFPVATFRIKSNVSLEVRQGHTTVNSEWIESGNEWNEEYELGETKTWILTDQVRGERRITYLCRWQ